MRWCVDGEVQRAVQDRGVSRSEGPEDNPKA